MTRPHPFARMPAPPTPGARGCLAALTVAGAVVLVGLALCGFVATSYGQAHRRPSALPASLAAPDRDVARRDLARARRSWGAIRAGFRGTNRKVPA